MKNDYKNALDRIKASDEFKDDLIRRMSKPKKKIKKIPYFAAAAACIAVAVGLTAIFFPFSSGGEQIARKPNHSFSLSAYAAETDSVVNHETYVKIGRISGYFKSVDLESKENSAARENLKGTDVRSVTPCFKLDLVCEGKNIETITFDAKGAKFWINSYTAKYSVKDCSGKSDANKNSKGQEGRCYKSFTVDYDSQVMPSAYGCMELVVDKKTYNSPNGIPKTVSDFFEWFFGYCRTRKGYYSDTDYILRQLSDTANLSTIIAECDKTELYNDMLNELLKDVSITVSVRYNDGTTQSKSIRFLTSFENGDNTCETDPVLKGKLV